MQRVAFSPRTERLADGTEVLLRLVEPSDGPLLLELFAVLSAESIYNRFLTPVREVQPEHLRRFVEIDHCHEVALAACLCEEGRWRIAGVGRYHRGPGRGEAEVAILVGDPWQCRGIGGLLLKTLGRLARSQGVRRFVSTVDPGNLKLLKFAQFYGYQSTRRFEEGLIRLETDLGA